MNNSGLVVWILIIILLIISGTLGFLLWDKSSKFTKQEIALKEASDQLVTTKQQLSDTKDQLTTTQEQFKSKAQQLMYDEQQLTNLQQQVATLTKALNQMNQSLLANKDSSATSTKSSIAITGVSATNVISPSGQIQAMEIKWTTNVPVMSQVDYGISFPYGNKTPLDPTLVINHDVILNGLAPHTTFHYRVRSRTDMGDESVSPDYMFATP